MSDIEMAKKEADPAEDSTATSDEVNIAEVDEALVLAVMAAVKKEQEAEAAAAAAAAAEAAAKKEAEEEAAAKAFSGLQVYDTAGEYDLEAKIPKEDYGYGSGKAGSVEVRIGSCGPNGKGLCKPLVFNPWSTLIGFGTLLGFALWCIIDPVNSKNTLGTWQSWCTKYFTWFYIASQDVWIIFLGFVYYYYGHIRLGKQTDKPEFDNATYFAMLFSAGVAVGLFVFGTAEPLYHYDYWLKQRFNGGDENQNDKANFAILTTIYHWGFHGWCVYTLVGLMMGIMAYRKKLPMTMRTCFYPLLGKHTWGWIGHIIDGFTIVTIVAGVCTSLGLGAIQIRRGLEGMGAYDTAACTDTCPDDILLGIIWGITAVATVSVVSGIHIGIKTLSQLAFGLGLFILVVVFFVGSTEFYMNNMTQAVGYYLQYFMTQLGWHTDAFAQLGFGEGASPDGRGAFKAGEAYGGAPSFMDGWTIFYWGWWIAWSPFVGQFVARISRGRSVREVINYSLTGPLLFAIIWFGVFGGAAIQMENSAQSLWKAGVDLYNDPTYFQAGQGSNAAHNFAGAYLNGPVGSANTGFGSQDCGGAYEVNETVVMPTYCHPAGSGLMNSAGCTPLGAKPAANDQFGHKAGKAGGSCGACFVVPAAFGNATYKTEDVVDKETGIAVPTTTQTGGMTGCELFEANPNNAGRSCPFYIKSWNANPSLSPQCLFTDWDQEASWYNVVGQFYTIGPFLQGISIITLVFYFITSSDSGSLVVDTIAANGRDEQNPIQRVIWALIEGLVATGLVLGGRNAGTLSNSKNVLKALQAASICCGLPFTFMLCFMMPALWKVLKSEQDPKAATRFGKFATPIFGGVFDLFESIFSFGAVPIPAGKVFVDWFIAAAFPWYSMNNLLNLCNEKGKPITVFGSKMIGNLFCCFVVAFCWFTWIVTVAMSSTTGLWSIGWAMWIFHAGILTVVRMHTRNMCAIGGNPIEDFWACTVMYPTVYNQCVEALSSDEAKSE